MDNNSKIFVAGHNGLVGSAIVRKLQEEGYNNLILIPSSECDLRDKEAVDNLFAIHQPEYVFLAAAKVGGILGNKNHKAEMIYDNIMIQSNIIDAAYRNECKKLLFLGSSCIYPKYCDLPIKEDYLLCGSLEPTNDAYAIAKIAGIKMCQSYHEQYGFNAISLMPCNLYGINDNFHPENSHVLPGLIQRFDEAKTQLLPTVTCWGDGSPMREFLYVDDLADACVHLMNTYDNPQEIVNVGTGEEISIRELAKTISDVVGYAGEIHWDTSKPNGTLRKVMDVSRVKNTGWSAKVDIYEGIKKTYEWYKDQEKVRS
jgi:GDP-L-fucose synthase